VFSPPFSVKPKIPMLAKVGGVVALAALAKFAIPAKEKSAGAEPYQNPPAPGN